MKPQPEVTHTVKCKEANSYAVQGGCICKSAHTPTPIKKNWTVWFNGISKADFIEASSRKEAIELFAQKEGVRVSSYIRARPVTFVEFKGGF